MPRRGNVLIVGPLRCEIRDIDLDDYRELNTAVDGGISSLSLPQELRDLGLYGFCDDDGRRLQAHRPNAYAHHLGHADLFGPVVLTGCDAEGETLALTDSQVFWLNGYLSRTPPDDALDAAANEAEWMARTGGLEMHAFDSMDDFLKFVARER
jgi:hypothetical protein